MKKMKTIPALMLMTMLSSSYLHANLLGSSGGANGGSALLGGSGGISTGAVMGEAGDYSVTQYDLTTIEKEILKHVKDRQNEDLTFLKETQIKIVDQLEILREELNKKNIGLLDMSIRSAGGEFIALQDFLGARKDFNQRMISIDNMINSILLLPSAINNQEVVNLKNGETKLPAPLKIQLDGMKTFFDEQKNVIIGQILNSTFNLLLPDGSPKMVKVGWTPDVNIIPFEKIAEMKEKAKMDMKIPKKYRTMIDEFNHVTKENFIQSIQSFGTQQIYRFDTESNSAAKEVNLRNLAEIFWARDLLRAWTGIQLGTFGIDYEIKKFEWNFFSDSNQVPWVGQFFTRNSQLTAMDKFIGEALRVQKSRDQEIFGKGVDLVDRVFSFGNLVAGQAQLSELNVLVLTLIQRDIEAETLLTKPGGRREMVELYRDRYYKNGEATKEVKSRAKAYKAYALGGGDGQFSDIGALEEGTISGAFSVAYEGLNIIVSKIDQAKRNLEAIYEMEKQFNNTRNRLEDEMDEL